MLMLKKTMGILYGNKVMGTLHVNANKAIGILHANKVMGRLHANAN